MEATPVRGRGRRLGVLACGLVLALGVAAGCGDDDGGGGGGSTSGDGGGGSATIEVIAPLSGANGAYQPWVNAVEAAVKSANAEGGTQIDLKTCDSGQSANTQQACARQVVSDGAVGVINMSSVATGIEPFMRKANIPTFDFLVDKTMYTSPISYSVASLGPASDLGIAGLAKQNDCKKLVLLRADPGGPGAAAAYIEKFEENAKRLGVDVASVSVKPGATDMSPYIAQAMSKGGDCLYASGFGSDLVAMLQAGAQASDSVKLMTVPGYVTPETIKSLGPVMDRVIGASFTWPMSSVGDHPGLEEFQEDMEKYAPSPNDTANASQASWADARALIDAVKKVDGDVTADAVIEQLDSFTDYDPVVGPPVTFSKENDVEGANRIFAPYAIQVKYVDGEPVAVGDFFDFYMGEPVATQ